MLHQGFDKKKDKEWAQVEYEGYKRLTEMEESLAKLNRDIDAYDQRLARKQTFRKVDKNNSLDHEIDFLDGEEIEC